MNIFNRLFLVISISIIVLLSACSGKQKVPNISSVNSPTVLKNVAVKVSQDIYDGKIDLGNQAGFIYFADDFYNKAGVPFIGEKIGTKKFKETIEGKKKIAKAMAAYNLSLASKENTEKPLLKQLKDKNAVVRAITIIFLGKINREKYYNDIEKACKNDNETFVKLYAIRELSKVDRDKYQDDLLKYLDDEHIFYSTMAAGMLLYEEPKKSEKILNKALESGDEILICRALEGLIDKGILINEDLVLSLLNDKSFLTVLNASELLLKIDKDKYSDILKKHLNSEGTDNKLAISISLLEAMDSSGLQYVKGGLKSKVNIERIYSARALINNYNSMESPD